MTPSEQHQLAITVADEVAEQLANRPRLADRREMAKLANISVATLDRRTKSGLYPSIKDGARRLYDPIDVIAAMKGVGHDE